MVWFLIQRTHSSMELHSSLQAALDSTGRHRSGQPVPPTDFNPRSDADNGYIDAPSVASGKHCIPDHARSRLCKENENSFTLHRHTAHFKGTGLGICILLANQQVQETVSPAAAKEKLAGKGAGKDAPKLELHQAIRELQIAVNSLMDRMKSGRNAKLSEDGVRQLLEKKTVLPAVLVVVVDGFGKKRAWGDILVAARNRKVALLVFFCVNFAARSVISPDPNIEPSEIGVPVEIASNLYYPEVVTPFNVEWLRSLVLRGNVYPGAYEVHIPKGDGSKAIQRLHMKSEEDRKALAKQLLSELKSGKPPYTVFRHLMDGDPLLVNRQPTLHKPGIMAHTAKVLKREATIRLHYVNCNTYNADFDGDEMNLHAPQDPISRMEALAIAKADQQYLVPTSGKPLRGLIQDHVIAGTMLTKRDSFYTKTEVCLLLYAGLRHALEASSKPTAMSFLTLRQKARKAQAAPEESVLDAAKKFKDRPWLNPSVQMNAQKFKVELDPPAVLRPRPLWSGKQVLSMLLKHLIKVCSEGKEADTSKGVNLDGKSKTPGDIWNGRLDGDKEEATVTFRGSDLLQGVLDKASFGAETAGITHMCFELMGGRLVSLWLSGIARLFTLLLQMRGFTCAYEDLVLRPEIDEKRTELVKGARLAAKEVAEQWIHKHGAGEELPVNPTPSALSKASKHLFQQKETVEHFEGLIIGKMKEFWSGMINKCIPIGQRLPVPRNCFASMVQTGAKGSKVNQSQVSCCLGQQELEGRLPPLMTTQRSLPCFAVRDLSNRTRGYIADRFLTGIRPQEFFFHCMAGREGLVDTAVKTSRSGYLQRCLVKHLEALKVSYDHTVRDSDGSVLQFLYGEDGVDVTRATYLFKFDELRSNFHFFAQPVKSKLQQMSQSSQAVDIQCARLFLAARQAAKDGNLPKALEAVEALLNLQTELDSCSLLSLKALRKKLRSHIKKGTAAECDRLFDPISAVLGPSHYYGATSEKHEEALQKYLKQSTESGQMTSKEAKHFERAMHLKFQRTLAEPGEAVGVIAAQSMGEPSTQMTLNTFHLAGHGGANVTLGIPRLREIIQTASRSCSTPLMTVPVLSAGPDGKPASLQQRIAAAQALKRRFRKVTVMDCVARLVVNESVRLIGSKAVWVYHCRIEFMPLDELCKASSVFLLSGMSGAKLMNSELWRKDAAAESVWQAEVQIRAESLAAGLRSRVSLNLVEDQDAAEHMARYLTWAAQAPKVPKAPKGKRSPEAPERSRLRTGATSGVAVAAEVLGQAMVAMSTMQDRFDRLNVAFQDLERNGGMASAFNGERPVAVDSAARASEATVQAAECCYAALKSLPASTVWVELPDPVSTADALEAAAAILKAGRLQLAELEAFQVVTLNRIQAQAKSTYRGPDFPLSPFKAMALTESPCGPKLCSASGTYLWSEARGLLKAFANGHKIDREFGASILSEVFHVFDDLIDGLARILEELICLESETDSMCPALLGAAQVQKDLLEWKLTLLDDEISQTQQCELIEFVEVVLAVGDALQAAVQQLRRRRRQVVEGMKASIEIKAAMMPATEAEGQQPQLFAD
ncbi:rpa1 [Symbiodinium sp. KB8]|nr:rpa1 [Symbiodinium sp. KB8]